MQKNHESGFGCAFWLAAPLPAGGEIKFGLKPFVCNGEMRIQMKKWSTKCEYQIQRIGEILEGVIFKFRAMLKAPSSETHWYRNSLHTEQC